MVRMFVVRKRTEYCIFLSMLCVQPRRDLYICTRVGPLAPPSELKRASAKACEYICSWNLHVTECRLAANHKIGSALPCHAVSVRMWQGVILDAASEIPTFFVKWGWWLAGSIASSCSCCSMKPLSREVLRCPQPVSLCACSRKTTTTTLVSTFVAAVLRSFCWEFL